MKRLGFVGSAIIGLAALLPGVPTEAGRPAPAAPDPAIAFVATHSSGSPQKLMVMNADGSNQTALLTSTTEQYFFPAWSPTGGRLLYQVTPCAPEGCTGRSSTGAIWAVDVVVSNGKVQGQNRQLLIDNAGQPAWAPANEHLIAYQTLDGISLLNVITGQSTLVVADPTPGDGYANVAWPAWNVSGTHLAYFYLDESWVSTLRIRRVVGEDGNPIENGSDEVVMSASGSGLDWSRDGQFLAYSRTYSSRATDSGPISILDLSTGEVAIVPASDWATMPTWPAIGNSELVFVNRQGDAGSGKRRIVNRDLISQQEIVLAEIKGYHCWEPDWRRD